MLPHFRAGIPKMHSQYTSHLQNVGNKANFFTKMLTDKNILKTWGKDVTWKF
jgi:hypothetical protein